MARRWALTAVVIAAACFGTLAVLTSLAYQTGAKPLPLLAWRFAISALLLGAVATVRDRRALVVPWSGVGRYALLALTGYGASSICFFYALLYADAPVVEVVLYSYPAIVTIAGWVMLRERASWRAGGAVLTTFVGCTLVVGLLGGVEHVTWQGVALGLGAAVSYALFNLLSHRWLPGRSRLTMMAYTFGIAALLPAFGALLSDGRGGLSVAGWTGETWALMMAIVIIPTFVAIILYLEGIRSLGPSQAALISTLEPIFTIVLAWLFLPDQTLTMVQLMGVALVLGGVAIAEFGSQGEEASAF